jgi:serine/threonine protein kinase
VLDIHANKLFRGDLKKDTIETGAEDDTSSRLIIGLKTVEGIAAMDYYLTLFDNSLTPIKGSTLLTVHFASIHDHRNEEIVSKRSFQFLKVIGSGGYSNVVLARKKDSGRMYAIKIIKKDKTYHKTNKNVYLSEVNIMKKLSGLPFIVNLHYTFQTDTELYFAMEPCIGGTLFYFLTHSAKGLLNSSIIKFYV